MCEWVCVYIHYIDNMHTKLFPSLFILLFYIMCFVAGG